MYLLDDIKNFFFVLIFLLCYLYTLQPRLLHQRHNLAKSRNPLSLTHYTWLTCFTLLFHYAKVYWDAVHLSASSFIPGWSLLNNCKILKSSDQKSRIRETLNLSTDADSSTDTKMDSNGKKGTYFFFFLGGGGPISFLRKKKEKETSIYCFNKI